MVNKMLALSRKKNEALVINNNIEVTILEIKGDQVKIGIAAPKEVPVYRKEVYLQIQNANQEATDSSGMAAPKKALRKASPIDTISAGKSPNCMDGTEIMKEAKTESHPKKKAFTRFLTGSRCNLSCW